MKYLKATALVAAVAVAWSSAVLAGPQWTYVGLGLSVGDGVTDPNSGQSHDTVLYGLEGSFGFASIWHVNGRWTSGEWATNAGNDVDNWQIGIGLNPHVTESTDLVADVIWGNIDPDSVGGATTEDGDYWGVALGVRSMITDSFELNAAVNYVDADCNTGLSGGLPCTGISSVTDVSGEVGGRFFFNPAWSIGARFNWDGLLDDLLTLDVRWGFD